MKNKTLKLNRVAILLTAVLNGLLMSLSVYAVEPLKFVDIQDPNHIVERLSDNQWREHFADGRMYQYRVWWLNGGTGPRIGIRDDSRNVDMFMDLSKHDQVFTVRYNQGNRHDSFRVRRVTVGVKNHCSQYLQNHIAWDYRGNKQWTERNLHRICDGAESSIEPGRCFDRVMHHGVNWGGGTKWNWNNAIRLCQGTHNADTTVTCFTRKINRKLHWKSAIQQCSALSGDHAHTHSNQPRRPLAESEAIVWRHQNGQVHYWPMRAGRRTGGINIFQPVGRDWRLKGIGDVNGDGTDDIVWQHNNGQVHYWPIRAGRRLDGIHIFEPVGRDWHLKGVGDVNGDGTDDIVWQHDNGQVHYWPMRTGRRTGGMDIDQPVSPVWRFKGVGDVNGDGTDDMIWQHQNGQVHYWHMENGRRLQGVDVHRPVGREWTLVGAGKID